MLYTPENTKGRWVGKVYLESKGMSQEWYGSYVPLRGQVACSSCGRGWEDTKRIFFVFLPPPIGSWLLLKGYGRRQSQATVASAPAKRDCWLQRRINAHCFKGAAATTVPNSSDVHHDTLEGAAVLSSYSKADESYLNSPATRKKYFWELLPISSNPCSLTRN